MPPSRSLNPSYLDPAAGSMDPSSQERKDDEGARSRTTSSSPSGEAELQKRTASGDDEEEDDDDGTRQPYKCTFCKRGFPTAQALGGHMNVHRRHKAGRSAAPPTAGAPAATPQGSSSSCYEQHPTIPHPVVAVFGHTNPVSWTTSMPAAGGGAPFSLHSERPPHELRLFGRDDCAAGRGKEGGADEDVIREHHRQYYPKDGDGDRHGGGEAELDLELRLGGAGS